MSRKKRIRWIIALLMGWILLGFLFFYYGLQSGKRSDALYIQIPLKTSTQKIGELLEDAGIIQDKYSFYLYIKFRRWTTQGGDIQAGSYIVYPNEGLSDIMDKLERGKISANRISVPEGSTIADIAINLNKLGYSPDLFIEALQNRKPVYDFEKYIQYRGDKKYQLEGYLAPATYLMPFPRPNSSAESQLVDDMLKKFQKDYWEGLNLKKRIASSFLPAQDAHLDGLITVASLVQAEGRVISEYPRITGVIFNRLKDNRHWLQRLSIDASNLYPFRIRGEVVTAVKARERGVKDPYNTYDNVGLPPGPINNPGIEAIRSVLEPEQHDYLFYVLRCDSSGFHNFSRSFAEHTQWVRKSQCY